MARRSAAPFENGKAILSRRSDERERGFRLTVERGPASGRDLSPCVRQVIDPAPVSANKGAMSEASLNWRGRPESDKTGRWMAGLAVAGPMPQEVHRPRGRGLVRRR